MNWDFSRPCQVAEAGGMGQQTFLFLIKNMCLLLGVCAWRPTEARGVGLPKTGTIGVITQQTRVRELNSGLLQEQ